MLEGIDASHWQGDIDWDQVAGAGYQFGFVKAIEGRLPDVDPTFASNWFDLCEREDTLVRGAYAFARPNTDGGGAEDGKREAEDFARVMLEHDSDGDWVAACDLEKGGMNPEHSPQQNCDFLAAWVEVCERELGRSPWIYTGVNAWKLMGWTSEFDHLPLWQADYTSSPAPMPWPLTVWQYSGDGRVPGISKDVDLNRFDGTLEQLRALAKPQIYTRSPTPAVWGPIMHPVNLAGSGPKDRRVAQVQGLLLSAGQGPDGLVDPSTGRPDGLRGPKTREAYTAVTGLADTRVNWTALLS